MSAKVTFHVAVQHIVLMIFHSTTAHVLMEQDLIMMDDHVLVSLFYKQNFNSYVKVFYLDHFISFVEQ